MTYDAAIILGGGITKTPEGSFKPTTYHAADADNFGMLGGEMRAIAAACLYDASVAKTFVFSTGVSPKMREKFGNTIPSEASVYAKTFHEQIRILHQEPTIILEEHSNNTVSNINEVLKIVRSHYFSKIAIISSDYHIPRIKAFYNVAAKDDASLNFSFLSAEEVVKQYRPGEFDETIEAAYSSEAAKKRITNEAQGLKDFESGKYNLEGIITPKAV